MLEEASSSAKSALAFASAAKGYGGQPSPLATLSDTTPLAGGRLACQPKPMGRRLVGPVRLELTIASGAPCGGRLPMKSTSKNKLGS